MLRVVLKKTRLCIRLRNLLITTRHKIWREFLKSSCVHMYLKFDEFLQLIYLYNRHQLYANNNNSLRLNGSQCRFVTICRLINFNSFYCDKWRNKVLSYKTKCFQTKTDNIFINTFHLISLGFVYVVQAVTQLQRLCSNYSCSIF